MNACMNPCKALVMLWSLGVIVVGSAASAATTLKSPYVTKGELEFEYFGSRTNDNAQKQKAAIGYGMTDYWFMEIEGNFEKGSSGDTRFDNLEVENKFQLTEPGEYWVDVGASFAYEWTPQSDSADTFETRFILAKDIGKTSHLLNLIAEKDVASGPKDGLEAAVLWSSRYRYREYFEPGFEIYSDFGEVKDTGSFDEQKHSVGPAAYGKIPLGLTKHADAIRYRAGHLFGLSDAAADGDSFVHLEYELHF